MHIQMENTKDIMNALKKKLINSGNPRILEDCTGSEAYEKYRLVFNRKFQFRPSLIIFVETAVQISDIIKFANLYPTEIILRFRSGGHDHEGECSGTNTVLLDFSKISTIKINKNQVFEPTKEIFKELKVGPGARFIDIKPELDKEGIGIPHGTCETVAIAGFTFGGGWGPWTRLHGMACESLIGATIILGDGDIRTLSYLDDPKSDNGRLLWALRGGGGISYGVVTELVFKTFALPDVSFSFNIKFNQPYSIPQLDGTMKDVETPIKMKAIKVLELWEKAIAPKVFPSLIGTNLKIESSHLIDDESPNTEAYLKCQMNGYYGGSEVELKAFIKKILGEESLKSLTFKQDRIPDFNNLGRNFSDAYTWHFESWDRNTVNKIKLDQDGPAPHKITSRLVNPITETDDSWNDASRAALICSLQSNKIPAKFDGEMRHGVHTYITLGAISGNFYENYSQPKGTIGSSFPYKKRPFIIQYQTWWNQFLDGDDKTIVSDKERVKEMLINRQYTNRALDWMEDSRDYVIPHTSGAFISFKDASIPTSTYFSTSYDDLIEVKVDCSYDPQLLFRTRKTIL